MADARCAGSKEKGPLANEGNLCLGSHGQLAARKGRGTGHRHERLGMGSAVLVWELGIDRYARYWKCKVQGAKDPFRSRVQIGKVRKRVSGWAQHLNRIIGGGSDAKRHVV